MCPFRGDCVSCLDSLMLISCFNFQWAIPLISRLQGNLYRNIQILGGFLFSGPRVGALGSAF